MYTGALEDRIGQGDILRDLRFKYVINGASEPLTESVTFDFAVVLTQDCDLEQDHSAILDMEKGERAQGDKKPDHDKYLNSVLVCPAFVAEQLRAGTHMTQFGWTMQVFNSKLWPAVKNNDNPRYHFLDSSSEFHLPDLVLDFKRFFTLQHDYLYSMQEQRVTRLETLFRESASQRFAYYLSRVALPEEKKESEATLAKTASSLGRN